MKKNNKGYSLVEVIIVIAIMAAVGGLITIGVSAAINKEAEQCAKKLTTALNNARISSMGKTEVYINLYQKDDAIWIDEVSVVTAGQAPVTKSTKIGSEGVEVQFMLRNGSYQELGDASSPLKLSFDRSSGSFKQTTVAATTEYCTSIKMTKGARTVTLDLAYLTGKIKSTIN